MGRREGRAIRWGRISLKQRTYMCMSCYSSGTLVLSFFLLAHTYIPEFLNMKTITACCARAELKDTTTRWQFFVKKM